MPSGRTFNYKTPSRRTLSNQILDKSRTLSSSKTVNSSWLRSRTISSWKYLGGSKLTFIEGLKFCQPYTDFLDRPSTCLPAYTDIKCLIKQRRVTDLI